VIHYDNKNPGFARLSITKKKTLLNDSIHISADYAIIRRYNRLSITNKFEIKLLLVRRVEREREGGWSRKERLTGNKLGMKFKIADPSILIEFILLY
jgi:hypothetical protein